MPAEPSLLIVEDEALLAMDVEFMAEQAGFRVVGHAMRGAEAIAMAEQLRPDVAVVDLQLLDGPTGSTVARHLAERLGALVLFMTANRQSLPADLDGAFGVIAKPYTESGFLQALRFVKGIRTGELPPAPPPSAIELGPAGLAAAQARHGGAAG